MPEYVIVLPAPQYSTNKDKYVHVDQSSTAEWSATGLDFNATRFPSMQAAEMFCWGIEEQTQVIPEESLNNKNKQKVKK